MPTFYGWALQLIVKMSSTIKCLNEAKELMCGAIDLHVHTSPSHFNRKQDDFALLQDADTYGLAGVVLKSHYEPTAARAIVANMHAGTKAKAYGGVVLNHPVGGLNPYAAESTLKLGGRIVWMPTRDAENCLQYGNMQGDFFKRKGIGIFDETGKIRNEILDIFDVLKRYDGWLATGHLSAQESVVLCNAGIDSGVKMILTHPEWKRTVVPIENQIELAKKGVIIEKCWYNVADGSTEAKVLANHLACLPDDKVFLSTDFGQAENEYPVKAFLDAVGTLRAIGVDMGKLRYAVSIIPKMIVENR